MKRIKTLRLYGGSMAYVLMISLMVSGLFSAFWLMQSHQQQFLSKVLGEERAYANLISGLNLFCISEKKGDSWRTALFESPSDSAAMVLEPWGLYRLAICSGRSGQQRVQKMALLGQAPGGYFAKSLFLADHRQPLCLAGDSHLGGELFLPGGNFKTASVLGKGFTGKKLPRGPVYNSFLKKAETHIPNLHSLQKAFSFSQKPAVYSLRDWRLRQPWDNQAFEQQLDGKLLIEACEISGKCSFAASENIEISADAKLDMVQLFAKHIYIKSGFHGRIQAFASQSIRLDSGVILNYPSVLMLMPGKEGGEISLGKSCEIVGGIGVESPPEAGSTLVKIDEGSHVQGHVWGMDKLDLRARISGCVITENFILQTAGGHFHNHLRDASIDFRELPAGFAMPFLQRDAALRPVGWLGEERMTNNE